LFTQQVSAIEAQGLGGRNAVLSKGHQAATITI
jgi:hypothetical protein